MDLIYFLFFLLIKHTIADLGLQGYISGTSKRFYFDKKLWVHGIHHGLGTISVAVFFVDINTAILLGILDLVLHWQIDYIKSKYIQYKELKSADRHFWWVQSIDQALHYCCYLWYVWIIV